MTGEHTHEWHYNEAKQEHKEVLFSTYWNVVRFCPLCRKLEIIELQKN